MLSVIIPAFNEEKRISQTLKKIKAFFDRNNEAYEVLIIDDGSKDETAFFTKKLISSWPSFRLIKNPKNMGKGAVVKQGMLAAKGEWRLFMDADSSTDISEVKKLKRFCPKFDVIIGSRYLSKGSIKTRQPLHRRFVSRFGNLLIRIFLGIGSVDTQCGFKLFSAEAAEEIFKRQTIMRWGFDTEILAIAAKRGFKITNHYTQNDEN